MSVRATVQDETTKIQGYMRKMAPKDELLSESLRQQKLDNEEEEEEYVPSWSDKHLHGGPLVRITATG